MNKVEPPSQTLQQLQQISHQLDQLNSQFNQFQHDRQPKKERKEQLTLAPGGWTFSSYGYKRFGLYVSAAQTITVSYAGITYALNLAAGLNVLQPLDETRITSATPFIAQAIWSDSIDFGTMIDQSANVSVINTPNVSATLTGSIAPDKANAPVIIDTIPFSAFTANATLQKNYLNKLNTSAKRRTFTLSSTLNAASGSISIFPEDNAAIQGGVSFANSSNPDSFVKSGGITSNNYNSWSSTASPVLGSSADSFILLIAFGASAPTSGNLYVVVREVL